MNKITEETSPLDSFFDFHLKNLTTGQITFDEVVTDFERNFVWDDDDIATAKSRTSFGAFLLHQNQTDFAINQLEKAESLLRKDLETLDCKEFLCLNIVYQADCHKISKPNKTIELLDKALAYSLSLFASNQTTNSKRPYGIVKPEDVENNETATFLFGMIAIIYAKTFLIIKNPMASEIVESFVWLDMACSFTTRALETVRSEGQKSIMLNSCAEIFGLLMGAAESSNFEIEENDFLDSLTGIDTLFENVEANKNRKFQALENHSPIKIITPFLFQDKFSDEDKDLIVHTLSRLNNEEHELEMAGCLFILEKIKFLEDETTVSEDRLSDIMDVFFEHFQRGHPWIVNLEYFIAQVCLKTFGFREAFEWITISIAESTILISEIPSLLKPIITGQLKLIAEAHKQNSNVFVFFSKLALAYNITYLNEVFDGSTSMRDILTLLDHTPEELINHLVSTGRIGEALELQKGIGGLMDNSKRLTSNRNNISFTEIEKEQLLKIEKLISNPGNSLEEKINDVAEQLTDVIETLNNEESNLDKQIETLSQSLINKQRKIFIDESSALIYYLPFSNQVNIVLITPNIHQVFYTEIDKNKLSQTIKNFLYHIKLKEEDSWAYNHKSLGQELYNCFIGNEVKEFLLKNSVNRIILAPYGVMKFIPFNALYDGRNFLIENFSMSLLSETSAKISTPSTGLNDNILFGATFNNFSHVTTLPNINHELDNIKVIMGNSILANQNIDDFREEKFNIDTIKSAFKHPFNIIHIASHFDANPANANESELQLGDGTKLTLKKLIENKKEKNYSNLLVFSACETGFPNISSANNSTPANLFHEHGIKSVLSTLWSIADESTPLLMSEFYKCLLGDKKMNIDKSLQAAQLKMLKGDLGSKYVYPFYWAAFILSGDWNFFNKDETN